jgi:hypothetical protein
MERQADVSATNFGSMSLPEQIFRQDIRATNVCAPCRFEWVKKCSKKLLRKPRTFSVSYQLGLDSAPTLFESRPVYDSVEKKQVHISKKSFIKAGGKETDWLEVDGKAYVAFRRYIKREWVQIDTGEMVLPDDWLKKFTWKWTGHFNTYIGKKKRKKKSK